MRVLGILIGAERLPRAVHIYRITLPLAYIRDRTNHDAAWTDAKNMALKFTEAQVNAMVNSDVIVLGRAIGNDGELAHRFMSFLKRNGAKLVYETDDDLTEEFRDISGGKKIDSRLFLTSPLVDAFTVTTPYLAERVKRYADKPVFVLPNSVEMKFWSGVSLAHKRNYTGTLNIMLVGTPTHGNDWMRANEAIERILGEYPNTRLIVGGYHPNFIDGDSERVVKMPFVEYAQYPGMMAEADIVICAIDPDDPFNYSKSAVKAMEAWASKRQLSNRHYGGAAVVATDSVVYNDTVIDEKNGLIAPHTVDGYYSAIKRLVDDDTLREHLQAKGLQTVIAKHSIAVNYRMWVSAYNRIRRL